MENAHKREHGRHEAPWHRNLHHDWRLWMVVGVMLIAMLMYVLSDNERFRIGAVRDKRPLPSRRWAREPFVNPVRILTMSTAAEIRPATAHRT